MRTARETPLEMARRHVRESEVRIMRQREIIVELRAGGHPTDEAEILLAQFEDIIRQHKAHLARLESENAG